MMNDECGKKCFDALRFTSSSAVPDEEMLEWQKYEPQPDAPE